MASELAKKVAGTLVDDAPPPASPVLRFLQEEVRVGRLADAVKEFAQAQVEILDPSLVRVESFSLEQLTCSIPSRQFDHESGGTFPMDVRFSLNPVTGEVVRLD